MPKGFEGFQKGHTINSGKRIGALNNMWKGGIYNNDPKKRKAFLQRRRKALKKGSEGTHTQGEWDTLRAQYNWTCPACGKLEPEVKLTEDHIIPLSKGGSDNIENIQPLCRKCNSIKHTKIIKYKSI